VIPVVAGASVFEQKQTGLVEQPDEFGSGWAASSRSAAQATVTGIAHLVNSDSGGAGGYSAPWSHA